MVDVLFICTGNIARSPLAAQLLRARLAAPQISVSSAGTHALTGQRMAPLALDVAQRWALPATDAHAHRARRLDEQIVTSADLVLGVAREHRRAAVELNPARMRAAFTLLEFERLARHVSDNEIAAAVAESDSRAPRDRLRAALRLLASTRGLVEPPRNAADDDVDDPMGHAMDAYDSAMAVTAPAVDQVVRVLRAALR